MIVQTSEIQQLLIHEKYQRDDSILFSFSVQYKGGIDDPVFLDEESFFQDTDHLIEDWTDLGAHKLVKALKDWVDQKKQNSTKKSI